MGIAIIQICYIVALAINAFKTELALFSRLEKDIKRTVDFGTTTLDEKQNHATMLTFIKHFDVGVKHMQVLTVHIDQQSIFLNRQHRSFSAISCPTPRRLHTINNGQKQFSHSLIY